MEEESNLAIDPNIYPKFEKYELIGSGTFGEVFRGNHPKTGEQIAIKKIKVSKDSFGISPVVLKEIVILRGLDHDNIIK